MNSGKVRIYELSRELNLENKDILAICEQLNIAVKSHSSTITDDDAGRIRASAQKYIADHPSPDKPTPSSTRKSSNKAKGLTTKPPVKKQQILEIRRHRALSAAPKPPESINASQSAAPAPVAPKAPALTQPSKPDLKLTAPNRPVRTQDIDSETEVELTSAPATDLEQIESDPLSDQTDQTVEVPAQPDKLVELNEPPVKPKAKANGGPVKLVNRPTLKRPKTRQESASQPSETAVTTTAKETRQPASSPEPQRQIVITEVDEPPVLRPKPTVELRRPRPTRAGEASPGGPKAKDIDTPTTGESGAPAIDESPRTPIATRPSRRVKVQQPEEDEQDLLQKPGKAGPKAKRRLQPVIDEEDFDVVSYEDEDIDEETDDNLPAPMQINLSLARPPKPKSLATQARPSGGPTSTPQKGKRSGGTRERGRGYRRDRREQEVKVESPEELTLTSSLTVHELANAMIVPDTDVVKALFFKGIAANVNQTLDIQTATMVAEEFGITVIAGEAEAEARKVTEMLDADDLENLQQRPPVVTIMGHVDHGKTTLLDSIRKTKVAQGEAGGITQHIGAYHVDVEHAGQMQQVVFLDTPGHEAFTSMRARGTRVTDIAVLVVAADDGVRPQTIEAISHAKAAEVPIVVAINKIDKEGAQPERVKQELTEFDLVPEEWGGETIMVPVSAINGENLDTLLEMLLLVSEVEDLQANPDRLAKGTIIEANLDKARGPVASLLIQNGTLRVGDSLVAGFAFGKVRAMVDDRGHRVEAAGPSFAVEVLGLNDVPAAGDEFEVFSDEKEARSVAASRAEQQRQSRLQQAMASRRVTLNTLSAQAQEGDLKELNLVLKADVQGSVEAILGSLQQLPQNEVQIRVLLAAPGEVTETDVDLAAASSAVIVGFNTTLAPGARQASDQAGVDVREYDVIYKLLEDIQGAMEGLLDPEMVEEPLGQVQVRAIFPVGRGTVAGCYIQSGKAIRNCKVRVHRNEQVVYEGNLDSLKRMKEDVKEVNAGFECGIGLDAFNGWQEGDIIETYRLVTKRRTLSMN
ncbi:MAG: translation initiation factor IF-2 [Cyanothece sp. SIO1E1]|nr:translation initiation factor IF-2 [Cyanothece sp. SIO1E1]